MPTSAVVVLVVLSTLAAGGCGDNESIPPPHPVGTADSADLSGHRVLEQLAKAISTGDDKLGAAMDAPGARVVETAIDNARTLGIRHFEVRDVDDDAATGPDIRDVFGSDARVDTVQISYRLPEDVGSTTMETDLVLAPGAGGGERIAAIGAAGARGALWLEAPIQVRRTDRLLLIAALNQPLDRYWRLVQRAARDVTAVLPPRQGSLVFEVPGSEAQLEQLMDAPAGTYRLIAGVTGSVDGSQGRRSPVHSFFNPDLMQHQGAAGGRLVVSHEATLQATRAPLSPLPIWLEEGFADYVPLRSADLPLRRTAHEVAQRVRRNGPPERLPTEADFDPTDTTFADLNAVYESAWLACRLIADRWSQATLLDFYAAVERGEPVDRALRDLLGVTNREFVAEWKRYVMSVAHDTSSPRR